MSSAFWKKLKYIHQNVLGMNLRNSEFIFKHNPIKLYPLVDNKILTKQALNRLGIACPKLYFTVTSYFEVKNLKNRILKHDNFVIKPANGFGGEGVLLGLKTHPDGVEIPGNKKLSYEQVEAHVQDILAGIYSLNQMPDSVLCEEKLEADPVLSAMTYKGIPDIRVIVFRGIPVMAMLRLSTQRSGGKANLHQGGIGVGMDMATGKTTHAISKGQFITHHPDSGAPLLDQQLPNWENILSIAVRCYEAVPLGYMGVDIVIDARHGPMVLEMNVRPGLMIQMANRMGIKPILQTLQKEYRGGLSVSERIHFGQDLFTRFKNLPI